MAGCAISGQQKLAALAPSVNSGAISFAAAGRGSAAPKYLPVAESPGHRGRSLRPQKQRIELNPKPSSKAEEKRPFNHADNQSTCDELTLNIRRAYISFCYDEVIQNVKVLVVHPRATRMQRAEAYALSGAAWYLMGNTLAARRCFRRVHEFMPTARLDKNMCPEPILLLFDEAGKEARTNLEAR